jgi:hypothetical protein
MERKVIQISAGPDDDDTLIYAVCDDGSVWKLIRDQYRYIWKDLPDIPQPQHIPQPQPSGRLRRDEE